jgi:hypothetical protein
LAIRAYLRALAGNSIRVLIPSIDRSEFPELGTFVSGHEYRDHRRHPFTLPDLMSPTHQFSRNCEAGRYMFVAMEVLTRLNVSACEILCFDPSVILRLSHLQPKGFTFFLPKRGFSQIRSRLPVPFFSVFNFEQYPSFPSRSHRDNVYILSQLPKHLCHFSFPNMRLFDLEIALKIREWADCQPCKVCGAFLL